MHTFATVSRRFIALSLGVIFALTLVACDKEPTVENRSLEERRREVATAFSGPVSDDGGKHAAGINALFTSLGKALSDGDHDGVRRHLDLGMMVQLMDKQGMLPKIMQKDPKRLAALLSQTMPVQLCDPITGIAYVRHEVRKVRFVAKEDEAVVITRHWDADGIGSKFRWWIYKDGDTWRAYDMEVLEMSMRFSTMLAIGFSEAEKGSLSKADLAKLLQAVQMVAIGEVAEAEETLVESGRLALPPVLEGLRLVMLAAVYVDSHRYDTALDAADKAEAASKDMPMVHYLRAVAFNGQKKHDQAMASANLYLEQLGEDADILVEVGDAHLGMGETDKAVAAYRGALKDDPQAVFAVLGLLRVDPAQSGSVVEDYRKIADVELFFLDLADNLVHRKDAAALRRLIDLHKQVYPNDQAIEQAEDKLKTLQ